MSLQELVLNLETTNNFLKNIGVKGYDFYSEITGTCTTYREFIDKVYEEFNIPCLVLGAEVSKIKKGLFKAVYRFDSRPTEFEFEIIER